MNVVVRLGEPFWRTVRAREVELSLADGATTADALAALVRLHPLLTAELENGEAPPAIFLDDAVTDEDRPLHDGAVVHVVWPISGG